jgi:glutamate dehydrogenase
MQKKSTNNRKQIKYITKLLEDNASVKNFVSKFLEDISSESLSKIHPKIIMDACNKAYNMLKNDFKEKYLIDISSTDKDADYFVITIFSDDMAFLMDSVNNELQSYDIDIKLLVHKVFISVDYKEFNLEKFKGKKIACVQFYISNWFDKKFYSDLKNKLSNILECVQISVNSWKIMHDTLSTCTNNLSESIGKKSTGITLEDITFLNFLLNDHFIFLGYTKGTVNNDESISINSKESLGLLRHKSYSPSIVSSENQTVEKGVITIKRSELKSSVHRRSFMLCITIKNFDKAGICKDVHVFYGFLITKIYYMSVLNIPLIRKKVSYVINKYGYSKESYNSKELIAAIEEFPRSELLQISKVELFNIATGIVSLGINPRMKLFIRKDKNKKYISCLIFIPKSKFNTQVRKRIENILCQQFNGFIAKHYVKIGDSPLTRLQLVVNLWEQKDFQYNIDSIEKLISNAVNLWEDNFKESLEKKFAKKEADRILKKYTEAFSVKYTNTFSPEESFHDVHAIEEALSKDKVVFKIYNSAKSGKDLIQLKIFSIKNDLHLSSVFPIVDNLGLFILDVATFKNTMNHLGKETSVYIHYFRAKLKMPTFEFNTELRYNLEEGLEKIWNDDVENDNFNSLIFYLQINYHEANLLRAYAKYLKQIKFDFTIEYILTTLVKYPSIARNMVKLFNLRFNPSMPYTKGSENKLLSDIKSQLSQVSIFVEDKILWTYLNLILATKRTNFFIYKDNKRRDFISLKINSSEVEGMPLPKPHIDTFVYSSKFEAIHLRGGKIARGGIRWTDRSEDFRKVILDLMKAQMTKNALIVPLGCKGGFVLKNAPTDKSEYLKLGIECYKNFLRGILDITDNIVNKKITHPEYVVRHDDSDTYFVVAADKGTATFSDYANDVSKEYNFWLYDAFASGGSAGYDHKKIGITAKGAWICVKNHFNRMGVDLNTDVFTAVGIGDMSGDVFGNGVLLSKKMKLVAAFNHMHIFLDPNPDPEISFKERERLFKLPGSKWSDYNVKLLSKGGGVFERSAKQINLSHEIKKVLGIPINKLEPTQLIKAILKAPVDLLWNGGIGTYVKGAYEDDSVVGDKSNDSLRILGKQLRCKVVGEGGNLGFTQKGRIEYAKKGGKINTDFIDNSGGVDCSDHEVNIKIALSHEVQSGNLTIEKRNKILQQLTPEVEALVLKDNYKHSNLLNLETYSEINKLEDYSWLINYLEERKELQREVENLPSQEELDKMIVEKDFLTRPEIAILIAYAKNSIAKALSSYNFAKDEFFQNILLYYFPKYLQANFKKTLLAHKLSNEIIITSISNHFVNMLGCTMFHMFIKEKGCDPVMIIKSFYFVIKSTDIQSLWVTIQKLPASVPYNVKCKLLIKLQKSLKKGMLWVLQNSHYQKTKKINDLLEIHKQGLKNIRQASREDNYLINTISRQEKMISSTIKGSELLDTNMLTEITYYTQIASFFDMAMINESTKTDIKIIAKIYFQISSRLYIDKIYELINKNECVSYTKRLANDYIENELRKLTIKLVFAQLKEMKSDYDPDDSTLNFIKDSKKLEQFDTFVAKILKEQTIDIFVLIPVIMSRLKELLQLDSNISKIRQNRSVVL